MKFNLLLFSLLISFLCAAQTADRIETDRPDQTETPFLVPVRFFQGEIGWNIENHRDRSKQFVHPVALLKYGLFRKLELRMEASAVTLEEQLVPNPVRTTFFQPLELGAKLALFEAKGLRPKASVITHLGLPFVGGAKFRNDGLGFIVRFCMQNGIRPGVDLGYNLGVQGGGPEGSSFFYTFAPGFTMGKRWYSYVEAFGSFYDNFSEHNVDGGIAYFLSNDIKLDLSAGWGLGSSRLKNYVALGFSFRFRTGKS